MPKFLMKKWSSNHILNQNISFTVQLPLERDLLLAEERFGTLSQFSTDFFWELPSICEAVDSDLSLTWSLVVIVTEEAHWIVNGFTDFCIRSFISSAASLSLKPKPRKLSFCKSMSATVIINESIPESRLSIQMLISQILHGALCVC